MLNDLLTINKKHEKAAQMLFERMSQFDRRKYIITISGEFGVGKCEVAHSLALLYLKEGVSVKILHMDNFYLVPPKERNEWRHKNGLDKIGAEEYDWKTIDRVIHDFLEDKKTTFPIVDLFTQEVDHLRTDFNGVKVLIVEGLYSVLIKQATLKVFIEQTYKDAWDEQLATHKEKLDDFRLEILKQEHKAVQSLKSQAEYFLDLDTSIFHL